MQPKLSLSKEEAIKIFNQVRLFVLADDEPCIQRAVARVIAGHRRDIHTLNADRMEAGFEIAADRTSPPAMLLLKNGEEARQAALLAIRTQISDALFIFDRNMGHPSGLDIFKEFDKDLPPHLARVLFSGNIPSDYVACLEAGILDAAILKPMESNDAFRSEIAKAYLKRMNNED